MIKEYYNFIKDYLKLAELKIKYVVINILSAFFYKGFSILLPLIASLIIKYLRLLFPITTIISNYILVFSFYFSNITAILHKKYFLLHFLLRSSKINKSKCV